MDQDKNEEIDALLEKISKLPEEAQSAVIWAIRHWELVELLCKEPEATNEELEEMKAEAKKKKDHLLFLLLCAAQIFNEH